MVFFVRTPDKAVHRDRFGVAFRLAALFGCRLMVDDREYEQKDAQKPHFCFSRADATII